MKDHTRRHWEFSPGYDPHHQAQVYDEGSGKTIAITYDDEGGNNARLIVACVNACEGINPEVIPELFKVLGYLREDLRMLMDGEWDGNSEACQASIDAIDRVINKAKGEEA